MMVSKGNWTRVLMIGTALSGMAVLRPAVAADLRAASEQVAQGAEARRFDIAPQPLADALPLFGRQAGLQVTAESSLVAALSSPGVKGGMSVAEALSRLLAGTGLTWRFNGPRTVVLEKAAADGAMTLDPVTVEGSAIAGASPSAVSEGTGSYAARAVTIGKTEQTLREIPQSVSVMTRQQMDDQGMTTLAGALRNAPGVTTSGYEATVARTRGFDMGRQQDGIQRQDTLDTDTYDLAVYDRLEFLRGPSGLLSGSGEPGGAVNMVRKRPLDRFAASGLASAGSWDTYRGVADLAGPLIESGKVRGRIVAAYTDGDTFYDVGRQEKKTAYGALEVDAAPDTTIGLTAIHVDRDYIDSWGLPLYSDGTLPGRSAFVGWDKSTEVRSDEVAVDLKHRFDNDMVFKMSAFRQDYFRSRSSAYSNGTVNAATGLAAMRVWYDETDTIRQGTDTSLFVPVDAFGSRHSLTVGHTWAHQDNLSGSVITSLAGINPYTTYNFNVSTDIATKTQSRVQQAGYYGVARLKPAEPVTVILGGRMTDYASKSRVEKGAAATDVWTRNAARADNEFTPYAGVVLDATRQLSVYASYADIFVPQGVYDHTGNVLDPRVGWQVESGIKGSFLDDRLNASLAAFRIRDQNRATATPDAVCGPSGTAICYLAAGTIESQGFEAEVGGSPLPGLDLTAAYTFTDIKDKNSGARYDQAETPKHLLKLWGHYRFGEGALGGGLAGWSVGAGVLAQSYTYSTYAAVDQDAYWIASAKAGYAINEHFGLDLAADNLFDRTYLRELGRVGWANMYGDPRTITVTLTARW
jgi:TonB-dependent siderophore receptor